MIQALLLAAGFSRRFGGDKPMHPMADGRPLIGHTLHTLRQACPAVTVIIRPQQTLLYDYLLQNGIDTCLCAEAEQGMGHSIACGVSASAAADGWLIALADMPYIQAATYAAVRDGLEQGHQCCRPVYQGQAGHPVGLNHSYFGELRKLTGDQGARLLLQGQRLMTIDVEDPGCIQDIDVPDRAG